MRKDILQPNRGSRKRPTRRGAMTAPMEVPPLKTAIPMARSFCGNHSATTFAAPGQLPASPRPRKKDRRKAGKAGDGRVRHGSGTPDDDGDGEAKARAVAIVEPAGDALAQGIGEE